MTYTTDATRWHLYNMNNLLVIRLHIHIHIYKYLYINILFNLHQTCAGPTLFEVGMLLYSAYIYSFMLTTLHLFDPFRFNSIVKPLGVKKGEGAL